VHYSSSPGGIEVLMPEIIRMLPGAEYHVFVIRPPEKEKINVYDGSVADVTYGSLNNFSAAWRLWRFGLSNREAVFHGFNTGPFFLFILRLAGVSKIVYSVRGTQHYSNRFQKLLRSAIWNLAITRRTRFIANSSYSRDVFIRYLPLMKSQIRVIYNPVYSDRIRVPAVSSARGGLNIIYVGRLTEGKNLFRWIDIAVEIRKLREDARFHLFGDGPLRKRLMEYSSAAVMDGCLFFRGYVQDLSEIYTGVDLLLFLSEYESFGNVVVESILCGTPVLVADIPSMREIFQNFPEFILPAGDQTAGVILKKIDKPGELQRATREAAQEFRQMFSIDQHINGLREVYDSLN